MIESPSKPPPETGFTLVETLIATAIIAMMTVMVFQVISANAISTRMMADRRAAVLVAKSALDMAIGGGSGIDVARRGTAGSLRWEVVVEPYQPRSETAPPLDRVTVTVGQIATGRTVLQLHTLRVGR